VAYEPSKFIKRQIHLQVTKARHRNAADTLDEDYRRVGPHTIVQIDVARRGGWASPKTLKTKQWSRLSFKTDKFRTQPQVYLENRMQK